MPTFLRFRSAVPNRHGRHPGVFALVNGLAAEDRLSSRGRIVHDDDVQVVAVPYGCPDDWPLTSGRPDA